MSVLWNRHFGFFIQAKWSYFWLIFSPFIVAIRGVSPCRRKKSQDAFCMKQHPSEVKSIPCQSLTAAQWLLVVNPHANRLVCCFLTHIQLDSDEWKPIRLHRHHPTTTVVLYNRNTRAACHHKGLSVQDPGSWMCNRRNTCTKLLFVL